MVNPVDGVLEGILRDILARAKKASYNKEQKKNQNVLKLLKHDEAIMMSKQANLIHTL